MDNCSSPCNQTLSLNREIEQLMNIQNALIKLPLKDFHDVEDLICNSAFGRNDIMFIKVIFIMLKLSNIFFNRTSDYFEVIQNVCKKCHLKLMNQIVPYYPSPLISYMLAENILKNKYVKINFATKQIEKTPLNLLYFLPEIQTNDKNLIFESYLNKMSDQFFQDNKNKQFISNRQYGKNMNSLAMVIKEDNLEEFQKLIKNNSLDNLSTPIPFSIYETGMLISDPILRPTPILYSAFYGSHKIFHFLEDSYKTANEPPDLFSLFSKNIQDIKDSFRNGYIFNDQDFLKNISFIHQIIYDSGFLDEIESCENSYGNEYHNFYTLLFFNKLFKLVAGVNKNPDLIQLFYNKAIEPFGHLDFCVFQSKDKYYCSNDQGQNFLHIAAINGDIWKLNESIYEADFNPNILDNNRMSPLSYAIENNQLEFAQRLILSNRINLELFTAKGSVIFQIIDKEAEFSILRNDPNSFLNTNTETDPIMQSYQLNGQYPTQLLNFYFESNNYDLMVLNENLISSFEYAYKKAPIFFSSLLQYFSEKDRCLLKMKGTTLAHLLFSFLDDDFNKIDIITTNNKFFDPHEPDENNVSFHFFLYNSN